ncbi:MAG: RlmE family RNA methyltransferase [Candidatus Thorarchaeota archaeon]|nr:RlmE family RNA methyltransferase [Candidatus Thorarchaeota archaeon]
MGRQSEGERRKREFYYRAAKKAGYRSRSAYKIKQIAKKHGILNGVDIVLELCSSPGGWTQVLRELNTSLQIVAIDLEAMSPVQGVHFIQGSILDDEIIVKAKTLTRGHFDLVLSDCSPKVSGHWELDVVRQLELASRTFEIGQQVLGPNGKALAKVFQGQGFQEFMAQIRSMFRTVKLIKPDASRKTSAEIYLLATGPFRKKSDERSMEKDTN